MTMKVSDVLDVPLRGQVLRLKVTDTVPRVADIAVGRRLRVRSPQGEEHIVRIIDHSVIGGKVTQARIERVREFDVLIRSDSDGAARVPVDFGYTAEPIAD